MQLLEWVIASFTRCMYLAIFVLPLRQMIINAIWREYTIDIILNVVPTANHLCLAVRLFRWGALRCISS